MKNNWNYIKKNGIVIASFFASIIVICAIFILQKIAPLGNNSTLTIDFFHQYGPMLGELATRIKNGSSLLYSFNMGMGLPFFRNFFNYLSSPFNIIILFFKYKDIVMSYALIIGFKAAFSASTMAVYLKNKFKSKNYLIVSLSCMYAFSAYFGAYYWNIMWLDGMVLLPLIILGLERLIDEGKYLLYICSLTIMLFANYFIGYMICLFCVLYFIMYILISNNRQDRQYFFKRILLFVIASLLAGGLCAWFLIPIFKSISGISATGDAFPTSQYYDFRITEFLGGHFSGVVPTVLKSGITTAPNISCGIISVFLLIIFLINPKINCKAKVGYSALLIFMIISFLWAPLDYIWHAFHVPNDLPYRYSFIYSFLLIVVSGYAIEKIKITNKLIVFESYIVSLLFCIILYFTNFANISKKILILNMAVLTIFALSYVLFKYFSKMNKTAVIFCILTTILEIVICINNNWNIDHDINIYYDNFDQTKDAISFIKDKDSEFYRIEKTDMLSFNDPSWFNYYGMTAFSSMEYENFAYLQHLLGMPSNEINSFHYRQNTPIYDLMFNMKYIIGDYDTDYSNLFYSKYENVYKNYYTAGLMFGVNNNIKNWEYNVDNPFEIQNDFVMSTTGICDTLIKVENVNKEIIYNENDKVIVKYYLVNNTDNYYYYINNPSIDFAISNNKLYHLNDEDIYYNKIKDDVNYSEYVDYNEKFIISNTQNNNVVYVGYNDYDKEDTLDFYVIDKTKLESFYSIISNDSVFITDFKEDRIEGFVNFDESKTIYTSIPYDSGWQVFVNDKKVDTFMIANSLVGFNVDEGMQNIVLKYKIPYIDIGLMISLTCLAGVYLLKKGLIGSLSNSVGRQ